jgi:hypothetical protein
MEERMDTQQYEHEPDLTREQAEEILRPWGRIVDWEWRPEGEGPRALVRCDGYGHYSNITHLASTFRKATFGCLRRYWDTHPGGP